MDPNVVSGLIGFGGAVVGGAAAIWGTTLTQKHATKMAKDTREADRQDAAFDMAVQAVFSAQDLFRGASSRDAAWDRKLIVEVDRLNLARLSLLNAELRVRLEEVALMLRYWKHTGSFDAEYGETHSAISGVIDHALAALGEYRREGKVPARSKDYIEAKGWLDQFIEDMEDHERHERENQL
ncbi:hypothetical protein ABT185_10730 [Streptomyces clavifer]|uniref:hypothetical protein n=1 Tax=Streptomyces clavifer TaxID=68188 RepID=UPI00331C2EA5